MVASTVAAAAVAVQLAEEGGILQVVGVGIDRDEIEILSVGGILEGVGGGLHACGACGIPLHPVVVHKVAPPAGGVDTVADVGGKGCRREVHTSRSAEDGAPLVRQHVGCHAHQQHATARYAVARVVYHRRACGFRLSEEEHLVPSACTHEVELVVGRRTHVCRG